MFILIILAVTSSLVSGGGLDLPSYISKCSLSDPELEECMKENANKAIPTIAKGDPDYGFPPRSPATFKVAHILGDNLNFTIFDASGDYFKDLRVSKFSFNLENGEIAVWAFVNNATVTAANYTINSGKLVDISASGHGEFRLGLGEIKWEYKAGLRTTEKEGETYLEVFDPTMISHVTSCHYYFENIESPDIDDVNAYINEHSDKLNYQLREMYHAYFLYFIHTPLNAIFTRVPMNNLFLP